MKQFSLKSAVSITLSLALGLVSPFSYSAISRRPLSQYQADSTPSPLATFTKKTKSTASQELNLGYIHELSLIAQQSNEQPFATLPSDLNPSQNETAVTEQIIKHNLSQWLRHALKPSHNLKRAVQMVEGPVNTNLFGSDENSTLGKLKLQVDAIQTKAALVYTKGLVDLSLSYKGATQVLDLELSKDLSRRTRLAFNHRSHNNGEVSDLVNLRFSW